MAHRIAWSQRALQDLEAIASYIAEDSPAYARTVVRTIVNQVKTLAHFPRSGRKVPEFDDEDIRESIAYNYRIIYRVEREEILIAAVISRQTNASIILEAAKATFISERGLYLCRQRPTLTTRVARAPRGLAHPFAPFFSSFSRTEAAAPCAVFAGCAPRS